ncbi:MAG: GNAT family N-acetyltransferase [Oscillospiraceae bacterium]|jgi:GNAT superfamily N-acetyltransferase|nr:GNAT family N-acetyltransferase [Oscillospiraceae bacterium]
MQIVGFTTAHIEQAIQIARQNYETERGFVPALPPAEEWPDLTPLAENGLGVAALDGGRMVGFLCGSGIWDGAWNMPELRHVFSPMHANGIVRENRAGIVARLYQAAGEKWARAGAASHGVCLYAHDTEGLAQFFRYGFGMRCIDAIRGMDKVAAPPCGGYTFTELAPEEYTEALPLDNMLHRYYLESPFFMFRPEITEAEFWANVGTDRYFAARKDGRAVAFLAAGDAGETFIRGTPGYIHADGAFCLPEHRGKGIQQNLLNLAVQTLKAGGYTHLGVDFESVNPSGSAFWLKHFTAYTHSVVRRVDEGAVRRL